MNAINDDPLPQTSAADEHEERVRQRQERIAAIQRDSAPVKAALVAAGVDTADFGRSVNRPFPGVLEPARFDEERALPVLLEWLPKVENEAVKESMVRHLKVKQAKRIATEPLTREFLAARSQPYQWAVGETLAYVADKEQFDTLVELAADSWGHGGRGPLVGMLWRVKTPRADEVVRDALDDPATARSAMSSLRRGLGNASARPHIEPLTGHAHEWIQDAAKDHLRRIDRALAGT